MYAKYLKKEITLVMHPVVPLFMLLAAMVLIPNYPYTVIFFYTTLSIFFTCMLGRENGDVAYSLGLPITKADVVRGRMLFVILIEVIQVILVEIFSLVRHALNPAPNMAGMEGNLALLGFGFALFGLFNRVFFSRYYRDINTVGKSFIAATTVYWVGAILVDGSTFAIPYVRDVLDTPDPQNLLPKAIVFIIGLVVFLLLNLLTCKKAINSFEKQDLAV